MITVHLHGWRKFGVSTKKIFVCCTSPTCFVMRPWQYIIGRYAICTKCFEKYIVLQYQKNQTELQCHKCTKRPLSQDEIFLLTRLEEEGKKDEFLKLVMHVNELESKQKQMELVLPPTDEIKDSFQEPGIAIEPIDQIPSIDIILADPARGMTQEQEAELTRRLQKKLEKLMEGKQ